MVVTIKNSQASERKQNITQVETITSPPVHTFFGGFAFVSNGNDTRTWGEGQVSEWGHLNLCWRHQIHFVWSLRAGKLGSCFCIYFFFVSQGIKELLEGVCIELSILLRVWQLSGSTTHTHSFGLKSSQEGFKTKQRGRSAALVPWCRGNAQKSRWVEPGPKHVTAVCLCISAQAQASANGTRTLLPEGLQKTSRCT